MMDVVKEILWALVNLSSIKTNNLTCQMVANGLIPALVDLIDTSNENTELSLIIISNLVADSKFSRKEICLIERSSVDK